MQEEYIKADAFILVYSCVDKASYTRIEQLLMTLQDLDLIRTRPVIIVANKIDLARSRAVSSQGTLISQKYILLFELQFVALVFASQQTKQLCIVLERENEIIIIE